MSSIDKQEGSPGCLGYGFCQADGFGARPGGRSGVLCSSGSTTYTIRPVARGAMYSQHHRCTILQQSSHRFDRVLACPVGPQLPHADVYTWVDTSGAINVSNRAPPEGVRVTRVVNESAPQIAAYAHAARNAAHHADLQVLSERIRQLGIEAQFTARQAPPQIQYAAIPAPPVVQYVVEPAPSVSAGCDSAWTSCGSWCSRARLSS